MAIEALDGVAQWIECRLANQEITGLIPGWGICLVVAQVPSGGYARVNHTLMFLCLPLSLPSPLSKNK